jgi:hypothetical protein
MLAAGLLIVGRATADSGYWLLALALLVLGAGMGLAMTPATAAITQALPAAEQGVASAVSDLARELGGALGIAVFGSVRRNRIVKLTAPGRRLLDICRRDIRSAEAALLADIDPTERETFIHVLDMVVDQHRGA